MTDPDTQEFSTTPEQAAAVLQLFGLSALPDRQAFSYALWPWWEHEHCGDGDAHHCCDLNCFDAMRAYMPDFQWDDAAAVELAERMMDANRLGRLGRLGGKWIAETSVGRGSSEGTLCAQWLRPESSLGLALLAALTAEVLEVSR